MQLDGFALRSQLDVRVAIDWVLDQDELVRSQEGLGIGKRAEAKEWERE